MPYLRITPVLLIIAATLLPAGPAAAENPPYRTRLLRWRSAAGEFAGWQRSGVSLASDGTLRLDPPAATPARDPYPAGGYNGRNFYNGGSFAVGEAVSPVLPVNFDFREVIPSWNAVTPTGAWIETQVRARIGDRFTRWYNLGVWASDTSTVQRHSVNSQSDEDGAVAVDTLRLTAARGAPDGVQLKLRLFSAGNNAIPSIRNAALALSTAPARPVSLAPGNAARWNRILPVPECSQMVYPDGGEVWCSPTSTSMILNYWEGYTGACEPRVRTAVNGTFDWLYDGYGNWAFNAAYAGTRNLEGYVTRFSSLARAEEWIAAGIPVGVSFAWGRGELTGAYGASSSGHLAVLVGFDANGNPVINDPYNPTNDSVQRTYRRAEFERLWLQHSGGTVYLIFPANRSIPIL